MGNFLFGGSTSPTEQDEDDSLAEASQVSDEEELDSNLDRLAWTYFSSLLHLTDTEQPSKRELKTAVMKERCRIMIDGWKSVEIGTSGNYVTFGDLFAKLKEVLHAPITEEDVAQYTARARPTTFGVPSAEYHVSQDFPDLQDYDFASKTLPLMTLAGPDDFRGFNGIYRQPIASDGVTLYSFEWNS